GAQQAAEPRPASLKLMDPSGFLRLLYVLFYPLKWFLWMVVPLITLAGLTGFQNWPQLLSDQHAFLSSNNTITVMIIGLFTVNLASRLAQGVAIIAHGGKADDFGISLVMGFLPRFYIDQNGIRQLDRQGQLWSRAAPLLTRLGFFGAGMLAWAITRDTGTWLPQFSLIVAQFGLGMFLISALPFLPMDGQRWLGVYFNEPRLLSKSIAALRYAFTGKAPQQPFVAGTYLPLLMLSIGMVLTTIALVLGVSIYAAIILETELGGTGVSIFLALVLAFVIWLLALKASIGRRMSRMGAMAGMLGGAGGGAEAEPALGRMAAPPQGDVASGPSGAARVVWGLIAVGLLAVAFLPYEYEAGGLVEILPASRGQAVARSDGELLEVMVSEGDIVVAGQVLAALSSWNQSQNVAITETKLLGAQASLARLEAGPKPEEVELALSQLARAESAVAFSQAEAERNQELLTSGTISHATFDRSQATYEADLASLDVQRANLVLVESGATTEELSIAQADVERLEIELSFERDEIERATIVAPMAGRVITADLQLRHGSFLRVGEVLLEIENAQQVSAAISIPESEIALIRPGSVVRLRAVGHADREILGTVSSIAPAADENSYGSVIRVDAVFDNPDDFLRTGMTGYAKIETTTMRVWEAYLRSIRRFFQVEVWSWIP
ncbi:MAG: efflux RND transporter periplasmic adaptor subunit, partial [Rhodobacteraceae bacterium]|nr:efflux RND transporter periplasmic adaptor subunit [Paracoccaceae bacterium]